MKLDEKKLYFNEVYFSDLNDKAQNFLLKNTLSNTEKQYDLTIKMIKELDEIIDRIKDIFKILFIENIETIDDDTNEKMITFYKNTPHSIQKIIEELYKLDTYIYHNIVSMIEDEEYTDYIKFMKIKLAHLSIIKNKIDPSLIPFSDYDILKNVTTNNNNITQNNNENNES